MSDPKTDDAKPRRVALGFHAGGALNLRLSGATLDALREALEKGSGPRWQQIETEDGPVLVDTENIIYVRPESTESRIGF